MRINDLITEDQHLEEGPIGNAVATGIRGVSKGVGGAIGGIRGAWDAAKQGYQSARSAVSGVPQPGAATAPAQQAAPAATTQQDPTAQQAAPAQHAAPAQQAAPAATTQQDPTAQIKADISKLDAAGKQDVMAAIQQSLKQPAPAAQQPAQVAPAQSTTAAPAGPQKGQQVTLGNETYQWLGAQWQNVQTKRVAEKGLVNQLNKLAQSSAPPATGTPDLKVVQGGQAQQAAESYKFESKFLGMLI